MKKTIVKITCDRCGKEIPDWFIKSFRLYKRKLIMTRGAYSEQEKMDLCKDCYESLRNWYYGKDEKERTNDKR